MNRVGNEVVRLHIVVASTRPGRIGPIIADWVASNAIPDGRFDARLVDLKDFHLPVYDEPSHPRTQRYEHQHTQRWSDSVRAADAFIFVTPEYNYGPPASLMNALTFVYNEWNYKPAAFVSYGGVSGGVRGVQISKTMLTTLRMVPILDNVVIPHVANCLEDGKFVPTEIQRDSMRLMLDEMDRWARALASLRSEMAA